MVALITYAFFAYLLMGWAFYLLKVRTWVDVAMLIVAPLSVWVVMWEYAKLRGR